MIESTYKCYIYAEKNKDADNGVHAESHSLLIELISQTYTCKSILQI